MIHKSKHMLSQIDGYIQGLENKIYSPIAVLKAEGMVSKEPISFDERLNYDYAEYGEGQVWGSLFECAWFHISGQVPPDAKGEKIVLMLDFSGEGLIFDKEGTPLRGITNVSSSFDYSLGMPGKKILPFCECSVGSENIDIWVDAGCNDLFGRFSGEGKIIDLKICTVDEGARELYYDMVVLRNMLECMDENLPDYFSILYSLQNAINEVSDFTKEECKKALLHTKSQLSRQGGDSSLNFYAVGHAHIDLAWLWPIRETRRKGGRTFSTQLELLDAHKNYVFGASQAQLYDWVKEDYPQLYARIQEKVGEGRWELQGGTWVEPDTNIPSGESLIRQFLYGQRFYRKEFGETMKILWLPDVFGYTAALPQIIKKSGCDYFQTIKISWNKVNKFPYHTFNWIGLDGSQVLVHMPPEGTYNSACLPESIMKAAKNYQEKGLCDSALCLFGIGDGGGGCGPEHLERVERIKNLPSLYPVKQAKAIDFFEHIAKSAEKYPTHKGELYVEAHQGTLTTQAKTKKYNRKIEVLFHDAELLSVMAFIKNNAEYPRSDFEILWKEFLLYQFHDILPGSSIKRVYDECEVRYAVIEEKLLEIISNAKTSLANSDKKALFNSLPWDRSEIIDNKLIKVKAFGCAIIENANDAKVANTENILVSENCIETSLLKIKFNKNGNISSVYDKEFDREIVDNNDAINKLSVFTDYGDAWDFAIDYRTKKQSDFKLISTQTANFGSKVERKSTYEFNNSKIEQIIEVSAGSTLINFITNVDWNEKDKMLRAEFPLNITSDFASCDIQFGNIKRSTLENNSIDYAQIEVAAHKYVDVSENNFGVALLNDCKYGYYIKKSTLSLNLLRSQNNPGISADIGKHEFKYALYVHSGNLYNSNVEKVSYEYNYPLVEMLQTDNLPHIITAENENIIIENIKLAEDTNDVIVRLYEAKGIKTNAKIRLADIFSACYLTNMIEDDIERQNIAVGSINLTFNGFEVHTLRLIQ